MLELKVTPQITPDDRVIMDLNGEEGQRRCQQVPSGRPAASCLRSTPARCTTQVLVNNGDTVVLGGIYETERGKTVTKVPLLGDIPGIGFMFRNTISQDDKAELLVFVTPKIIKDAINIAK